MPQAGKPTLTARAIVELQQRLPDAKVLYSSATGASEPRHLAYMVRSGIFALASSKKLIDQLLKEGNNSLAMSELAAMSQKASGSYLARTLSYAGAEFALAHTPVDPLMQLMYDRSTAVWHLLWRVAQVLPSQRSARVTKAVFWASHQRFYRNMLMAAKVLATGDLTCQALAEGKAVVIGLQTTGEAGTEQHLAAEAELQDLVSGCAEQQRRRSWARARAWLCILAPLLLLLSLLLPPGPAARAHRARPPAARRRSPPPRRR
jgi:hypothetical protein